MTLLLRNSDIVGLAPIEAYVEAVERGYHDMGRGHGENLPRHNVWLHGEPLDATVTGHVPAGARGSFKFKGAHLPGVRAVGLQAYTAGLPAGLQTFLFLFDTDRGVLDAILEIEYLDWLKTAAVGGLATRLMAPEGARIAGLFGTGRHARSQLHAMVRVRPFEQVLVYGRDRARREAFCERMRDEIAAVPLPSSPVIEPVAHPDEILASADVITTITTSKEPVFDGRALPRRPIHVNALGAHYPWVREIDEHVMANAHIVGDVRAQALLEQGELLLAVEAGAVTLDALAGDLGDVVVGSIPGRSSDRPWSVFLSGGTGVEDVAVAAEIVTRARAKGVGTSFEFGGTFEYRL